MTAKEFFDPIYLLRLVLSMALVAGTGWLVTWFVADWAIDKAMTAQTAHIQGVETKQESDRKSAEDSDIAIRGDLSSALTESSKRLETAILGLSGKMDLLSQAMSGTSEKVATLTTTVEALNGKLNDSITRQVNFEKVVLAQLLKSSPANLKAEEQAMQLWLAQGVTSDVYNNVAFGDANAVATWAAWAKIFESKDKP